MGSRIVFDQAGLDALFNGTHGAMAKEMKKKGIRVARTAKRLAPVDTGRLRSSIAEELSGTESLIIERVGSDVNYAAFVELGTSRSRAKPYLRPALANELDVA